MRTEHPSRHQTIQNLTRQLRRLEHAQRADPGRDRARTPGPSPEQPDRATASPAPEETGAQSAVSETLRIDTSPLPLRAGLLSTGVAALDNLLPNKGLQRGSLVEWLAQDHGSGAGLLALRVAREALHENAGALVVIDPHGDFYAPAAADLGIDLAQLLVIRPATHADALWTLGQALGCPGVAAVLCNLERLDDRSFRRLQLAAETGGGLGLLLRPGTAQREPSWAEVRFLVTPLPHPSPPDTAPADAQRTEHHRRLRVTILRCRGGISGAALDLEFDHETGHLCLASELAAAASVGGPPGTETAPRRPL